MKPVGKLRGEAEGEYALERQFYRKKMKRTQPG